MGSNILAHLVDVSVRSVLVALAAAAVLWALRSKRNAALEHAVWTMVLGGMLLLLAVGPVLPELPLRILHQAAEHPAPVKVSRRAVQSQPPRRRPSQAPPSFERIHRLDRLVVHLGGKRSFCSCMPASRWACSDDCSSGVGLLRGCSVRVWSSKTQMPRVALCRSCTNRRPLPFL